MSNGDDTSPGWFVLGDSIGQGIAQSQGYDNVTKVGANPQWVYDQIAGNADRIKGRNVILSTGVTNNPQQMSVVDRQLEALDRAGAAHVYVAGTSNSRPDLAGLNSSLQDITHSRGFTFGGGYDAGKDQIHPANYGGYYGTLTGQPGPTQTASVTPMAGATPPAAIASRYSPATVSGNVGAMITGMHGGQDPGDEFALRIRDLGEKSAPGSVSPKGAMGRMQVMPGTARDPGMGITPARDMSENELNRVGVEYAKGLLNKYDGNQTLASAAYNAGPNRVDQWIKQYGDPRTGAISEADWASKIPIGETRAYVGRVTGGQLGVPGQAAQVTRLAPGQTNENTAGQLHVQAPTNPLALPPPPAPAPSMNAMLALAMLAKMVPSTHQLHVVDYDPFAAGQRRLAGDASPREAPQVRVNRPTEPITGPSVAPGSKMSIQELFSRVTKGDTGRTSLRGAVRGGSESQYG